MYDKLIIYYFTGTGNAKTASNWIKTIAQNKKLPVELINITPTLQVKDSDFSQNTLIGLCYPTHGFNAPPVVLQFCRKFPKIKNNVFLLNTRAGMKLYKIFTPGLSGLAQLLPAFILRVKGLKTIGYQPMDLPSNWISIHPGIREKVVNSIFERCKQKTNKFAERTLAGEKTWQGWLSLPIDVLISPISVAYYFFGRYALSKTFIADYKCNNCGLCQKECPVGAIKTINNRPYWTSSCESCMHCMNSCPQRAIQTPHLFTFIIWWLVFSLIPVFLTRLIAKPDSFVSDHFNLFANIFMLLTGIPLVFFSYRILHFLLQYSFFSRLIAFTSFTKLKVWRRYFAPKKYLKL